MTARSAEELNEIADAITRTIQEAAEAFSIAPVELAATVIGVACNIGYSAWGAKVVEHLRNAADVMERQMLNDG
jgi:hypothetical protein